MKLVASLFAVLLSLAVMPAFAQVYVSEGFFFLSPSVGYRFSPYIAAEVGAFKAKEEDRMSTTGVQVTNGSNVTERQELWNVSGYRLAAVGTYPVWGDLYALGRLGLYRLKGTFEDNTTTTFRSSVSGVPSAVVGSTDSKRYEERTELGLGLGLEWRIDKHVGMRVLYEQVKTDLSFDGKVRLSTFEISYTF